MMFLFAFHLFLACWVVLPQSSSNIIHVSYAFCVCACECCAMLQLAWRGPMQSPPVSRPVPCSGLSVLSNYLVICFDHFFFFSSRWNPTPSFVMASAGSWLTISRQLFLLAGYVGIVSCVWHFFRNSAFLYLNSAFVAGRVFY